MKNWTGEKKYLRHCKRQKSYTALDSDGVKRGDLDYLSHIYFACVMPHAQVLTSLLSRFELGPLC